MISQLFKSYLGRSVQVYVQLFAPLRSTSLFWIGAGLMPLYSRTFTDVGRLAVPRSTQVLLILKLVSFVLVIVAPLPSRQGVVLEA